MLSNWTIKKAAGTFHIFMIILYCLLFSFGLDNKSARAGVFEFAGEVNGADIILHPTGYRGVGGNLIITVGISPSSPHAGEMVTPVQNAVNAWNHLIPTQGNLENNSIPRNQFDFESVVLHELGHCMGLSHPNLASESGLAGPNRNYTRSAPGANLVFDIDDGADGVIGSNDDIRNDDINLHWFRKLDNNPFAVDDVVDITTYSRNLSDLPVGHRFAANADRNVAAQLGVPNTESVMQQGIFAGETRRLLTADDVATLRLGMSGLDMIAGTSDDYTVMLRFDGFTDVADIVINFDNTASFAACSITAIFISQNHLSVINGEISLNTGFSWFFNDKPTPPIPPERTNPMVSILANDVTDAITLNQGDTLSLAVMLNPGVRAGNSTDYWVRATTPLGTYWLDAQLQFIRTDTAIRVFGGALGKLPSFTFYRTSTSGWPPGIYTITFAIDNNMDGIVNGSFHDSVIITINP